MKLSKFAFLILITLVLFSCGKENLEKDQELIFAIQQATNKQSIQAEALPGESKNILDEEFSESYTEKVMIAPGLGYEVKTRREKGTHLGESFLIYFNLEGKELQGGKDKEYGKGEWEDKEGKDGKDRKECFDLIYPVTFTMPDASTITGNDEKEVDIAIKAWYTGNPDAKEKPNLIFPVNLLFEGSHTKTISSEEELVEVYEHCKGEKWEDEKEECFDFIYPVTYVMPDQSSITGNNEEEIDAEIKAWYIANPDQEKEEPVLEYPVNVLFDDNTTKAINNDEEMEIAIKYCK